MPVDAAVVLEQEAPHDRPGDQRDDDGREEQGPEERDPADLAVEQDREDEK
mgnify:CR=1 FL=1